MYDLVILLCNITPPGCFPLRDPLGISMEDVNVSNTLCDIYERIYLGVSFFFSYQIGRRFCFL